MLPRFVRSLCDREGIFGADGVYFVDRSLEPARATYFNADGSAAETCGNGLRCVARLICEAALTDEIEVLSGGYLFRGRRQPPLALGVPSYESRATAPIVFGLRDVAFPSLARDLRFSTLFTPNPHLIAFVDELDEERLGALGRAALLADRFPNGVNTSFARLDSAGEIRLLTFERGVGPTLSCASAAVAAAATLLELGMQRGSGEPGPVRVRTTGGPIVVRLDVQRDGIYATQSGNATFVYATNVTAEEVLAKPASVELDAFTEEIMAFGEFYDRYRADT